MLQRFFFLVYILFLSSCSVQVHSSYDQSVDFSKYKTFCWFNGCEFTYTGPTYLNDSLLREKIKEAIVAEMAKKGIREDQDHPDLLLDFHITVENETSIIYHHNDYIDEFNAFVDQEVINYLKGTMVLDMVDKAEAKIVWRSEAIGFMDDPPDLSTKNIQKGIAITLKKFPPPTVKPQ